MAALLRFNQAYVIIGYVGMVFVFLYQIVAHLVLIFIPRWLIWRRKDITGQKVLITGAGCGLGRELAVEFSKHAACLLLVDIDRQALLQTQKLVEGRSTVFVYECDVSDCRRVSEMSEQVKRDAGDVDILVNNAGIVWGKYLVDLTEDKIARTMEVNALAHFWTVKAVLPAMMRRNSGHVVSIASVVGKVGATRMVDYCASKFAAIGFAESLEVELREQKLDGIKVTIVCPAHLDTGLFRGAKFSMGQILSPAHAAKEIVSGVLEEREKIYLPPFLTFFIIMKECVPRWLVIKVKEFTGDINMMKNFTGGNLGKESL